ncbi:MAG: Anti-sigma factor RshA [Gemmatimonadaceae bacterium]|nr:Anti-sigma factor RshA [Gemmatimonadaceae bacterium]
MTPPVRAIDCHSALRQLWDYLDHELTPERVAEMEQHLSACRHCLPHRDFAQRFLDALHRTRDDREAPPTLRDRVVSQLAEAGFTPQ